MAEAGQRNRASVLRDARSVQMRWQDADPIGMTNARNHRPVPTLAMLALLLLGQISCAQDPAEAEYFRALRGEETGMGRAKQLAHIERAIALQPGRAWYWETHAIYSIDVRDYETAAADLNEAVRLADRPYLRHLRGLVACQRGKYESSLEDFDRAIAGQPKNTQFYRGRSLARSKRWRRIPGGWSGSAPRDARRRSRRRRPPGSGISWSRPWSGPARRRPPARAVDPDSPRRLRAPVARRAEPDPSLDAPHGRRASGRI